MAAKLRRSKSGGGGKRKQRPRFDAEDAAAETVLDEVEEVLAESFPASDPPSWTVTKIGSSR